MSEAFALFDAAVAAQAWSLSLSESMTPGVGAALIGWAAERGHAVTEHHFVSGHTEPYANLKVAHFGGNITVLGYRLLTAEEAAIVDERAVVRSETTRVGSREVAL